jgi:hypothetical protein
MLNKTYNVFQGMIKAVEVLAVIGGNKKAARLAIPEERIEAVKNFCRENNLAFLPSDYRVRLSFSGDYSSKGIASKSEGHFLAYISGKPADAEKAKRLEEGNRHAELGKILGYPACCTRFFARNFGAESKGHNDFVMPAFENSAGFVFPWQNNVFGRYFDVSLLSHCPHSFSCEKSLGLARQRFEMIKKHDENVASQFSEMLHSAVLYSPDGGKVYLLPDARLDGKVLGYSGVLSTSRDSLLRKLQAGRKIRIRSRRSFEIGGEAISMPILVFR